jgi:hypothetical protein
LQPHGQTVSARGREGGAYNTWPSTQHSAHTCTVIQRHFRAFSSLPQPSIAWGICLGYFPHHGGPSASTVDSSVLSLALGQGAWSHHFVTGCSCYSNSFTEHLL